LGKIVKLDKLIIERIAAGEVVERPASVVKELIENSIDAEASAIRVELSDAGLKKIRVIDNGVGMDKDDAVKALERYTTSKIKSLEDLYCIKTLGFRGEALASIAAVSRLEIVTRTQNSEIGTRVVAEGGVIKIVEPIGAPVGTTVTVYDLFFNAPARLKFLKSRTVELSHSVDIVTKYALIFPDISFELSNDGTQLISSPQADNILEKIVHIYGTEIARNMIQIDVVSDNLYLYGYVSKPSVTRSTKKAMHVYVNKRFVISNLFHNAILDGCRSMFFRGRYPICVLNLEIDPNEIDVNVHPTKLEVKFKDENKVFHFISEAIREALLSEELEPEVDVERIAEIDPSPQTGIQPTQANITRSEQPPVPISSQITPSKPLVQTTLEKTILSIEEISRLTQQYKIPWNIVGQVAKLFIIAYDNENMYIIDQHAAHERILYEKLLSEYESGEIKKQTLLEPILVSFPIREALILKDNLDMLNKLGFEIAPFGEDSFVIRAVPVIMKKVANMNDLKEFLDELLELEGVKRRKIPSVHEIFALMACKAAIKDNDVLDADMMVNLIKEMHSVPKDPYHCPHGRPTILAIPLKKLRRLFKRTA